MMTGCLRLTGGGTGITSRIGYYDDLNGMYFQDSWGTLSVVVRSSVTGATVDDVIPQSSWNLDKVDGTGPSGYDLDITKLQLFVIDFEWLGAGFVRFGIFVSGEIVYVHIVNYVNTLSTPYISTPNLPLRVEIMNDGTGVASTLRQVCSSISSEAGNDRPGLLFTASTGPTHLNADVVGTKYALISVSPQPDRLGVVTNQFGVSVLSKTNDNFEWSMVLNPVVAGTMTHTDYDGSSAQVALGTILNTVTNGILLASAFTASSGFCGLTIGDIVRFGSTIAGVTDRVVLCVTPLTAGADIVGSVSWREIG